MSPLTANGVWRVGVGLGVHVVDRVEEAAADVANHSGGGVGHALYEDDREYTEMMLDVLLHVQSMYHAGISTAPRAFFVDRLHSAMRFSTCILWKEIFLTLSALGI